MAEGRVPTGKNRLLLTLDNKTLKALEPYLERVELGMKVYLYESGKPIEYAYFPIDGVMSLLAEMRDEKPVEVATIGNEGMVGLPLFLGVDITPGVVFSQVPGAALRMKAARFKALSREYESFRDILHRYTQALMVQISQGTACNRAHSIEQRCARWILLTHDRVTGDEFTLTQEFLGQMLGVRRASVNAVASPLQEAGIIAYSRGKITVLDRRRLEATSCHCYQVIRGEYDRMLNGGPVERTRITKKSKS